MNADDPAVVGAYGLVWGVDVSNFVSQRPAVGLAEGAGLASEQAGRAWRAVCKTVG